MAKKKKGPTQQERRRQSTRERERHERAERSAATRKAGGEKITSKTERRTVANIPAGPDGQEIGFTFSDILAGRNPSNPETREAFDDASRPYLGDDVQLSYWIATESGDGTLQRQRIRRIVRNFQGREDIARLTNSAVRYGYDIAMKNDATLHEVYVTSVSIALLGGATDDDESEGDGE